MQTVGQLARRFGLSRSTLLYYSRIGVLRPSGRSRANYRLYSEADAQRLAQIVKYRAAGLALADIAAILETRGRTAAVLEARFDALDGEIQRLREQQRVVLALLQRAGASRGVRRAPLDKERWVALLRASGLDDDDMRRWHFEFERMEPGGHQDFLESLGIPAEEVEAIRAWSRDPLEPTRAHPTRGGR